MSLNCCIISFVTGPPKLSSTLPNSLPSSLAVTAKFSRAALRYSGAGDINSVTSLSTSLRAVVVLVKGIFNALRTAFRTAFMNCFHTGNLLPLVSIEASFAWNSGLEKASATNSSRLVAP